MSWHVMSCRPIFNLLEWMETGRGYITTSTAVMPSHFGFGQQGKNMRKATIGWFSTVCGCGCGSVYSTGMVQTKIEDRFDVKREPTNSFSSWEHDKEKRRALKLFGGCSRLLRMQCNWKNRYYIERSDLILITVCGLQWRSQMEDLIDNLKLLYKQTTRVRRRKICIILSNFCESIRHPTTRQMKHDAWSSWKFKEKMMEV